MAKAFAEGEDCWAAIIAEKEPAMPALAAGGELEAPYVGEEGEPWPIVAVLRWNACS